MVAEETVVPRKSIWVRRLDGPAGSIAALLYFAVVAGITGGVLVRTGLALRWALALGWPLGLMFLVVREAVATRRWPTAGA